MPTPPVPISNLTPQPSLPSAPAVSLASPLPALVLTFLQLHPTLSTLVTAALHHSYPLNVLLLNKVPPLILPSLPQLLTPEKFHQQYYLHAFFQGWELYQTSNAAIVLFEHSDTGSLRTYGFLRDYYRLYLFVFSPLSDKFFFSLLLQGTSPAPEISSLLLQNHVPRSFPPPLLPFTKLLPKYPQLSIISDLPSTTLANPTIYLPVGQYFAHLPLPNSFFAHWATSLFEPGSDTPMWAPDSIPPFSGAHPFIRHIQFWLFMHNAYQEAYTLPPCPYVFLHFLSPGQTSESPSFYFCINNATPSSEHLLTFICPHVFVFDTHRDTNMEYYGVIVARPSSLYADLDAAALEAKPITYP